MNPMKKCLENLVQEQVADADEKNETRWRPKFHLSPPVGWLNDPNGLCFFQGRYHAYFQYSPFEPGGGLKFWGHSTSTDLLNWTYEGCSIYPDSLYDCHGVYSGSALPEDGQLYLYYTGNCKREGDYDFINEGRDSNVVMAVSGDGCQIGAKNLLLDNHSYPEDLSCHVRDPKVWKENSLYYMILGARTKNGKGLALLYESADKYAWSLKQRIEKSGDFGYMWECPDLFEIDGNLIFLTCPQGMKRLGIRYQNLYQTGYFFMSGNIEKGFELSDMTELDYGFDFYAPQSFVDPTGRRILIGWMGMPDVPEHLNPTVEYGWNQILTLPRELFLKNGRLCQRPVRELDSRWIIRAEHDGAFTQPDLDCYQLDISDLQGDLEISVENLKLSHRQEDGIFHMCFEGSSGQGRKKRSCAAGQLKQLSVIVDSSSVEVFLNDGESVLTTRFYPENERHSLCVKCAGGKMVVKSSRPTLVPLIF